MRERNWVVHTVFKEQGVRIFPQIRSWTFHLTLFSISLPTSAHSHIYYCHPKYFVFHSEMVLKNQLIGIPVSLIIVVNLVTLNRTTAAEAGENEVLRFWVASTTTYNGSQTFSWYYSVRPSQSEYFLKKVQPKTYIFVSKNCWVFSLPRLKMTCWKHMV